MTADREYFESDNQSIGYRFEGYRDFGIHYKNATDIMKFKPKTILEIGGARGYVAKKLLNLGVERVVIMDKSDHCYNTRAVPEFVVWDVENTPYPFRDKEFDLVYSNALMEHISEDVLPSVIKEIGRISNRSFHNTVPLSDAVTFEFFSEDSDHKIYKPKSWWIEEFKKYAPNHTMEIRWVDPIKSMIIPLHDNMINLNIGSGYDMIYKGWVNIDTSFIHTKFPVSHNFAFLQHNFLNPLPYDDNTVDLIFSQYIFGSSINYEQSVSLMKECYRVLKPNGVMRLCVIDARKIMDCYARRTDAGLRHILMGSDTVEVSLGDITRLLKRDPYLWDSDNIIPFMGTCGFPKLYFQTPFHSSNRIMLEDTIVKYPDISLVVEGVKR